MPQNHVKKLDIRRPSDEEILERVKAEIYREAEAKRKKRDAEQFRPGVQVSEAQFFTSKLFNRG